jgi:hypothetical protein
MSNWETVRRQVAISGRVTDAATGKPIAAALISVSSPRGEIDVVTAVDGHFHLLDLPDGSYDLRAAVKRPGSVYGSASATAEVSRDAAGRIRMAVADMQLDVAH